MKIRTIKKLAKKKGFKPTPKQRRQFMTAIGKSSSIRNAVIRGAIRNNRLDVVASLLLKHGLTANVAWERVS